MANIREGKHKHHMASRGILSDNMDKADVGRMKKTHTTIVMREPLAASASTHCKKFFLYFEPMGISFRPNIPKPYRYHPRKNSSLSPSYIRVSCKQFQVEQNKNTSTTKAHQSFMLWRKKQVHQDLQ